MSETSLNAHSSSSQTHPKMSPGLVKAIVGSKNTSEHKWASADGGIKNVKEYLASCDDEDLQCLECGKKYINPYTPFTSTSNPNKPLLQLLFLTNVSKGRTLQAHKLMPSAFSGVLKEIFLQLITQNPLSILKDIAYRNLQSILDFVYHGEVNIQSKQQMHLFQNQISISLFLDYVVSNLLRRPVSYRVHFA